MKLNLLRFILSFIIIASFSSCDWLDSDDADISSDPCFLSFGFSENVLKNAYFTLESGASLQDSIIVNLDSLPYNTDISYAIATFRFKSTSATYVYPLNAAGLRIDTINITETSNVDTLDFTCGVEVRNIAEDKIAEKTYLIKVNVHKVEPELYVWNKVADNIYSHLGSNQKAFFFSNTFLLYVTSSVNNYLYTSPNGSNWTNKTDSLDLPINSSITNMLEFKDKLYVLNEDDKIYSSLDGYNWSGDSGDISDSNYRFQTLLFELNGKMWSIMKSILDDTYHFSASEDGQTWLVYNEIPANFPVGDFAALSFASRSDKPKAILAGGYAATGELLDNIWSTEDGTYWVDFSVENTTLGSLSGATILPYDDKLLLFGGMDEDGFIVDEPYMQSIDEGLSWSVCDTTYSKIQQMNISVNDDTTYINYAPRSYQSAINIVVPRDGYNDYFIYLIGGKSEYQVYKDVWVGKLNRLSFIR